MFSLLSMSPISDWLAPDLSPLEEFKAQYEMFISYFAQQRENGIEICKCHIESTNLTMILTKMCNLLIFEQAELSDPDSADSISTSIEYFLQNNLANILAVYAQADAPLGLCPIILLFFNKLIADCKLDLMPHACFHVAVNKLVTICGRIPAGPYEMYEIIFLQTLIESIDANPEYINFFAHNDTFSLVDSLLCLLQSPDSNISTQAGDCILKLLNSANEHSLHLIVERTPFCEIVINKVIQHYNDIPRNLNPNEIEIALTAIQFDQFSGTSSFTNAVRKFLSFLKWFMFYDSMINHSFSTYFQQNILTKIRTEFFEAFVLSDLLGHGFDSFEDAIDNCFLTTVIVLNCLKTCVSQTLTNCICEMLTITESGKYIPYHPNVARSLIERCNLKLIYSSADLDSKDFQQKRFKLACATYQLFDKILSKPFKAIIKKLILNDLCVESGECASNSKPELTESYINRFLSQKLSNEINTKRPKHINIITNYQFITNAKLCAILYYFDSLVPNEFRFGSNSDYEAYGQEALKAFQSYFESVPFDNFQDVSSNGTVPNDDPQQLKLNFVDIVLDSLQFLPRLPYEIGVQICSCLAKMSMIIDPKIDNKLLDSTINDTSKPTLFNALFKLISELQVNVSGIENLNDKLIIIKKILLGEVKRKADYSGPIEEQQILQSIIVVDEFCKEIAAIALVKQKLFTN